MDQLAKLQSSSRLVGGGSSSSSSSKSSSKVISVSASSVIELKAELLKRSQPQGTKRKVLEDEIIQENSDSLLELTPQGSLVAQGESAVLEMTKHSSTLKKFKNLPKLNKQERTGVTGPPRSYRTVEQERDEADIQRLEASWVALQRKSKLYDDMIAKNAKEVSDDDTDDDDEGEESLVDFIRKEMVDAPSHNPAKDLLKEPEKDSWVEITDEFGRTRVVKATDAPLYDPNARESYDEDAVLEETREREAQEMQEAMNEERLNRHYDAKQERRNLGVGHYAFSQDESERQKQIQEIKDLRVETLREQEKSRIIKNKRNERLEKRKQLLLAKRK